MSITATPNSGYSFSGWSNGSTANPLNVNLNSNTTVTANFQVIVNSYNLTVSAGEGGSVSGGGEYEEGTEVTITATPDEGYEFTGWSDGETSLSRVITISSDINISASFEVLPFVSRAPSYSGINNTVGSIKKEYYYPGYNHDERYINPQEINLPSGGLYRSTMRSIAFLDFDSNGYLDLFAVLNSEGEQGSLAYAGTCSTKIKIVKNIFTSFKEEYVYDSPYNWPPSDLHVNDFNGDGIDDVIVTSTNNHLCGSYNGDFYGDILPVQIYYINNDGSFEVASITSPTTPHDLASGDIDNDGDIDIVYWGHFLYEQGDYDEEGRPFIYLNSGSGNFVEATRNDYFINYDEMLVSIGWDSTNYWNERTGALFNLSINLFDLNNDGILDMVVGGDEWEAATDFEGKSCDDFGFFKRLCNNGYVPGLRVFWGQGDGKFDFYDYSDVPNVWMPDQQLLEPKTNYMGIAFKDYNNDGYYDIIASGTPKYFGEFIHIGKNNGDKTFEDVTRELVDIYYTNHGNQGGPNAMGVGNPSYTILMIYDKDNDGDYDIIPSESEWSYITGPWNGDFYFQNNAGFYSRVYEE